MKAASLNADIEGADWFPFVCGMFVARSAN